MLCGGVAVHFGQPFSVGEEEQLSNAGRRISKIEILAVLRRLMV